MKRTAVVRHVMLGALAAGLVPLALAGGRSARDPGSPVCGQSTLFGTGSAAGRSRPTSPVCFKLRAPEPPQDEAGGWAAAGPGGAVPTSPFPGPPVRRPKFDAGPPAVRP